MKNYLYSQCRTDCPWGWYCRNPTGMPEFSPCGGHEFSQCAMGTKCYAKNESYSECRKTCPSDWPCLIITTSTRSSTTPVTATSNSFTNATTTKIISTTSSSSLVPLYGQCGGEFVAFFYFPIALIFIINDFRKLLARLYDLCSRSYLFCQ